MTIAEQVRQLCVDAINKSGQTFADMGEPDVARAFRAQADTLLLLDLTQVEPEAGKGVQVLLEVLRHGKQLDSDGIRVDVSRQAVDEAAALIESLSAQLAVARAVLDGFGYENVDVLLTKSPAHGQAVGAESKLRVLALKERAEKAEQRVAALKQLDSEAVTHVESLICLHTHFTGEPPYVGWKGLGLALKEHLDNQEQRVAEAEKNAPRIRRILDMLRSVKVNASENGWGDFFFNTDEGIVLLEEITAIDAAIDKATTQRK